MSAFGAFHHKSITQLNQCIDYRKVHILVYKRDGCWVLLRLRVVQVWCCIYGGGDWSGEITVLLTISPQKLYN